MSKRCGDASCLGGLFCYGIIDLLDEVWKLEEKDVVCV